MTAFPKDGTALTLNIYKPYALFPMSQVLTNKQDKYTYTALTEIQGYFAPQKAFRAFIRKNPGVLFDLLKRIYSGLEGFFGRMESLLLGDACLRLLTQLVIHAKRFGQKDQNRTVFGWHVTQTELASQTGLARETVARELKKLQDKGLVGYHGKRLFVTNTAKLEQEFISSNNLPLDKV